ncbi:MAG: hypothetical protein ABIP65_08195 [Vicinamibacterales bacterium]
MSKFRKEKKGISQKRSMAGKVAVMGLLVVTAKTDRRASARW